MSAYEDMLARRAASVGQLQMAGGSGYFAARAQGLDPALFERGDHLQPSVRLLVLKQLYTFWSSRYQAAREWSTAWIAGSGITTAWNADREGGDAPGDLDVLIGVDYGAFFRWNPKYAGNPESALAHHFNQELHDGLWPSTANIRINNSMFELTYYVNPGGADIRDINPYAAYDVSNDTWTVHPVDVPVGFSADYFRADERATTVHDTAQAGSVLARFNDLQQQLGALQPASPQYANLAVAMHVVIRDGAGIYDVIHNGRRAAFAPGGKGYFDFANYRWQQGKLTGAIQSMRALKKLDETAHRDISQPCDDVGHLLLVAGLANGGR